MRTAGWPARPRTPSGQRRSIAAPSAGHTLATHRDAHGRVRVTLTVYPAAGACAAERHVVSAAVRAAAEAMRRREQAGERVLFDALIVHGDPVDDPEVEALAQWLVLSSTIAEAAIDDAIRRIFGTTLEAGTRRPPR